jgi:pantoate--beta-alanine ligase
MTETERLPIQIVAAPTIREDSGLAMSSRNMRLDANQMKTATSISRILFKATENARAQNPLDLVNTALGDFAAIPEIKLEYFALVVASSFEPVTHWPEEPCVFLVACYVGDVRLIDNVMVR